MAEITLRLKFNVQTGKKDIYIDFVSEEDALPIEHEKDHRNLVEALVGQGALGADEIGQLIVRRVAPEVKARLYEEQMQIEKKSAEQGQ